MVRSMRTDSRAAVIDRRPDQQPPRVQQWEYRSRLMNREAPLDQFGAEGWELVSVIDAGADQAMFYFRRRRP